MAVRGYFDIDANTPADVDFYSSLDRKRMIANLALFDPKSPKEPPHEWDRIRAEYGSPFNPAFDWDTLIKRSRWPVECAIDQTNGWEVWEVDDIDETTCTVRSVLRMPDFWEES